MAWGGEGLTYRRTDVQMGRTEPVPGRQELDQWGPEPVLMAKNHSQRLQNSSDPPTELRELISSNMEPAEAHKEEKIRQKLDE